MADAVGIVGVDGHTPIYQPDGRWVMWNRTEIYEGKEGDKKYIPKVNDYVINTLTGDMWIVTNLDPLTFIPSLKPVQFRTSTVVDDLISTSASDYRLYYNKYKYPYTLVVDGLLRIYIEKAAVARIYRGVSTDEKDIISKRTDRTGNMVGYDIPLTPAAIFKSNDPVRSYDNYTIKSIPPCTTNVNLKTGEICTVAVFDSENNIVHVSRLKVEEMSYVTTPYTLQKYITNIYLESAFIDATNNSVIIYPINMPVSAFNPMCVVQYNDGTTNKVSLIPEYQGRDYSRDNGAVLHGLESIAASVIGHKIPLVLSYRYDPEYESVVAPLTISNNEITVPYTLLVSNPNRNYNVKLYVYPVWVDEVNGYKYSAKLYTLDRNIIYDVTSQVTLSNKSPSFNPKGYGLSQRLEFSINLKDVSSIYNDFIHIQTVDIVLRAKPTDTTSNIWEVATQLPTTIPYYGTNLKARYVNSVRVNIANNIPTVKEFIERVYRATMPLYNPQTESQAPDPTHFIIRDTTTRPGDPSDTSSSKIIENDNLFVSIDKYAEDIVFSDSYKMPMYGNVNIVFAKKVLHSFIYLSEASMCIRP